MINLRKAVALFVCAIASAAPASISDESSGTQKIVLGAKIVENPYTVANFNKAALSLSSSTTTATKEGLSLSNNGFHRQLATSVSATHKYVEINPATEADLNYLEELEDNMDIVIHDHPLDYETVVDGDYFVEPTSEDDVFHKVYCVVPSHHRFPTNLNVRVLDELHEPSESEEEIELKALEQSNLDLESADNIMLPYHQRRNLLFGRRWRPQGCIRVFNTNTGRHEPLRQAKVSIGRLVWWKYVHTNDQGCFVSPKRYRGSVKIRLKWRSNVATIRKSWNEMLGIAVSDRLMSMSRSSNGRTYNIPTSDSRLWYKSTVHNGLVKYNDFAAAAGISKTVRGANVWVWENGNRSGAAPMLNHYRIMNTMARLAGLTTYNFWQGLVTNLLGVLIGLVPARLRPDLIFSGLGTQQNTRWIEQLVFHESGHFSHAVQSGSWWWAKLFSAELKNIIFQGGRPYADGTKPTLAAGHQIGLAEGWATLTEYRAMDFTYGQAVDADNTWTSDVDGFLDGFQMRSVPMSGGQQEDDGWFLHGLFWDVVDTPAGTASFVNTNAGTTTPIVDGVAISGGSRGELYPVFRFLTSSVYDACDYGNALVRSYPGHGPAIEELFTSYGFPCVEGGPPVFVPVPSPVTVPTPVFSPIGIKGDCFVKSNGERLCP